MATKKITYWVGVDREDCAAFNIRQRLSREAFAEWRELNKDQPNRWSKPVKVTVEYNDPFDLLDQCLGEDSRYWEPAE